MGHFLLYLAPLRQNRGPWPIVGLCLNPAYTKSAIYRAIRLHTDNKFSKTRTHAAYCTAGSALLSVGGENRKQCWSVTTVVQRQPSQRTAGTTKVSAASEESLPQ